MRLEELLTPTEAARQLRVSRRTLYEWIKEGRLKSYKIGGRLRLDIDDLIEFARRGTAPRT